MYKFKQTGAPTPPTLLKWMGSLSFFLLVLVAGIGWGLEYLHTPKKSEFYLTNIVECTKQTPCPTITYGKMKSFLYSEYRDGNDGELAIWLVTPYMEVPDKEAKILFQRATNPKKDMLVIRRIYFPRSFFEMWQEMGGWRKSSAKAGT